MLNPGTTVVGHQGEQEEAENTALGGTSVQGDDAEDVIFHMYKLGSVGEEVQ